MQIAQGIGTRLHAAAGLTHFASRQHAPAVETLIVFRARNACENPQTRQTKFSATLVVSKTGALFGESTDMQIEHLITVYTIL